MRRGGEVEGRGLLPCPVRAEEGPTALFPLVSFHSERTGGNPQLDPLSLPPPHLHSLALSFSLSVFHPAAITTVSQLSLQNSTRLFPASPEVTLTRGTPRSEGPLHMGRGREGHSETEITEHAPGPRPRRDERAVTRTQAGGPGKHSSPSRHGPARLRTRSSESEFPGTCLPLFPSPLPPSLRPRAHKEKEGCMQETRGAREEGRRGQASRSPEARKWGRGGGHGKTRRGK